MSIPPTRSLSRSPGIKDLVLDLVTQVDKLTIDESRRIESDRDYLNKRVTAILKIQQELLEKQEAEKKAKCR